MKLLFLLSLHLHLDGHEDEADDTLLLHSLLVVLVLDQRCLRNLVQQPLWAFHQPAAALKDIEGLG